MIFITFTLLTGILLSLAESDIMTREVEALIWLLVGAARRVLAGYQHLLQHNVPLLCKVGLYTFQLPRIDCKHYLGHYLNVNFIQWIENSRMYKGHGPLQYRLERDSQLPWNSFLCSLDFPVVLLWKMKASEFLWMTFFSLHETSSSAYKRKNYFSYYIHFPLTWYPGVDAASAVLV